MIYKPRVQKELYKKAEKMPGKDPDLERILRRKKPNYVRSPTETEKFEQAIREDFW